MLPEVLAVFVIGIFVGQALRWRKQRFHLFTLSAVAASALLFTLGLSIGLEKETFLHILPEAAGTSLLLGATSAVASAFVTFLIRGRKRD